MIVVVTNQRGVARDMISMAELDQIHRRLKERLREQDGGIDAAILCSRALWLDHGRVRAIGAAAQVVEEYLGGVGAQAE